MFIARNRGLASQRSERKPLISSTVISGPARSLFRGDGCISGGCDELTRCVRVHHFAALANCFLQQLVDRRAGAGKECFVIISQKPSRKGAEPPRKRKEKLSGRF